MSTEKNHILNEISHKEQMIGRLFYQHYKETDIIKQGALYDKADQLLLELDELYERLIQIAEY